MNLYYRHSWIFIVDYHAQDPEKDNKCDAEYWVDCPRKSLPEPEQNVKNILYYWKDILVYYTTLFVYNTILYYSYTIQYNRIFFSFFFAAFS